MTLEDYSHEHAGKYICSFCGNDPAYAIVEPDQDNRKNWSGRAICKDCLNSIKVRRRQQ